MKTDNSTGKDREFYEMGKKIFDRIPRIPQAHSSNRQWIGLTEGERVAIAHACGAMSADWLVLVEAVEKALEVKNA